MYDVCVTGGGAAGMMCAVTAAKKCLSVLLIEKNEKLGKKLFITGKGRCNFTNCCDPDVFFANVISNPKFLYSAFYDFSSYDCISFFEESGLRSKTERGGRVFPASDKSSDVIKVLEKELRRLGVCIRLNTEVKELILSGESGEKTCKGVVLQGNERVMARHTVIATGGISYPSTGSTGDGFRFAGQAGLEMTALRPGLVPLCTKEAFVKDMQGLSLKNAEVRFFKGKGGSLIHKDFGEMLFTHFGISGPVILSASSLIGEDIKDGNVLVEIDLKPALTYEQLDKRLVRELTEGGKKTFKNILKNLLPSSAVPVFISLTGCDPDKPCNEVSKKERHSLRNLLKCLSLTVTGPVGTDEAIITRGGVSVKEIDPSTMKAKKIKGLYFIGEVLDTDALTGGFNLQIAWSTAVKCGRNMT